MSIVDWVEWEVELAILGPIVLKKSLELRVQKGGPQYEFETTVKLANTRHGISAKMIAQAGRPEDANDVSVYFVGQMLDVLSLRTNLPIEVSLSSLEFRPLTTNARRVIQENEWKEAFESGRRYGLNDSVFSRALSWYRKGLVSENPIDRLLAFWSALEAVGAKHARRNERTDRGAINQVCDCFDQIWVDDRKWRVIPGQPELVNEFHEMRSEIAHGGISVNVETLQNISSKLPTLQDLAHSFLVDWEREKIRQDTPERNQLNIE